MKDMRQVRRGKQRGQSLKRIGTQSRRITRLRVVNKHRKGGGGYYRSSIILSKTSPEVNKKNSLS